MPASSPPRPASGKARYFVFAALIVVADLLTKWWVFEQVEFPPGRDPRLEVVPGFFWLTRITNPGAVGGLGGENFRWPLVALRLAAVVVVAYLILRVRRERWFLLAALAAVLGGAAGNLYDNLALGEDGQPGEVRDFLAFDLSPVGIESFPGLVHEGRFNPFNVADSFIVCGAIALMITSFARPPGEGREAPAPG